jgi:Flp pilus assembly protein protease CpaA
MINIFLIVSAIIGAVLVLIILFQKKVIKEPLHHLKSHHICLRNYHPQKKQQKNKEKILLLTKMVNIFKL